MNAVLCVSGDCTPFGLIWVYRPSDTTSRARHLEHIPATKTIVCLVVVLPLLQVRKKTATVAELSMAHHVVAALPWMEKNDCWCAQLDSGSSILGCFRHLTVDDAGNDDD